MLDVHEYKCPNVSIICRAKNVFIEQDPIQS